MGSVKSHHNVPRVQDHYIMVTIHAIDAAPHTRHDDIAIGTRNLNHECSEDRTGNRRKQARNRPTNASDADGHEHPNKKEASDASNEDYDRELVKIGRTR